jgi:hypothetical protein
MPEKAFASAERPPQLRRPPVLSETQTPSPVLPHGLTGLHAQIGNHAMRQLLVARQVADAPTADAPAADAPLVENPLSPAQVGKAIAFYKAQPKLYTTEIIEQIQTACGTEPTGKMSAEDVQAVARKQQELNVDASPPLKIDGMAGPRTLPSIFKFGLREDDEVSDYTETARDKWENRGDKTDEEVTAELVEETNKHLDTAGVPPMELNITDRQVGRGAFDGETWQILINDSQFKDPKLRSIKDLTSTIYHEGRHAEQKFKVAQMLAGQKKSVNAIHARTGIKIEICEKARENPIEPGTMEAVIAQGWDDSLHSDAGIEKIRRNNAAIDKAFKERKAAREAFEKDPTPANEAKKVAAEAKYDATIAEHDEFPHEHDAERVEDQIKQQLGEIK